MENINEFNIFVRPEKPFLLIYGKSGKTDLAWLESEDELRETVKELKIRGYEVYDAIEIGSCRDILIKERGKEEEEEEEKRKR